jgi:glutathione synthase/RimK-type ligase-like ATP-grasp enzyme
MTVLFVSDPATDAHLPPLLTELALRGRDVQVFNPAAFPNSAVVTVDSTASGPRALIAWGQQTIDLSAIGSVWYRRPGKFDLPHELLAGEADWLRGECASLIDGIYATTDALWVSDPHSLRRADLKLLQLRIAQRLGFRIPDYTVTNDPGRAKAFLADHSAGVIVKGLSVPTILVDGRSGMLYTHLVTREDEEQLESVRYAPTFLQSLIPKARDIRVTIIGEKLFAVAIESMTVAAARIDFRSAEIMDLPHRPITLPQPVTDACHAIVRELGLRFGAVDLLETPEGEYVFLEINPNGQWYWIEAMTGQPMASAMADLLERGEREPRPSTLPASLAERTPHILEVGEQTIPASPSALHASRSDPQPALTNLTATHAWFEKKQSSVLLHVGDVEDGPGAETEIAPVG